MFQQFKTIMRREFPHARFDGAVLSPGWVAEAGAQALSMGFFATIVMLFAGDYMLPPQIAALLSENKVYACNYLYNRLGQWICPYCRGVCTSKYN